SMVYICALSSKINVMDLQNNDCSASRVIWTPDSNWLVFSSSSGTRVTDTYVYHRSGDDFGEVKTENLQVDVKGDVRNQYVTPLRWVKPAVLLLEQLSIFRGAHGQGGTYQFPAGFAQKTGKLS